MCSTLVFTLQNNWKCQLFAKCLDLCKTSDYAMWLRPMKRVPFYTSRILEITLLTATNSTFNCSSHHAFLKFRHWFYPQTHCRVYDILLLIFDKKNLCIFFAANPLHVAGRIRLDWAVSGRIRAIHCSRWHWWRLAYPFRSGAIPRLIPS